MTERIKGKPKWRSVDLGSGHIIQVREIDPKIQALMPVSGKNFLSVGPIEFIVGETRKFLKREPNELFP